MSSGANKDQPKLSWKEGLFLVGPDPLTSPYYSSGALIMAGVGYTTPAFQIGLYLLLFLLAPLYVEAVLLTLSNGGTYVMTRYALSHLGKLAFVAAAVVGVVISFSYVATALVSLLSYSSYVLSLVGHVQGHMAPVLAIALGTVPALAFGLWVMPSQWPRTSGTIAGAAAVAVAMSTLLPTSVAVMLVPLVMLFVLNNFGLRESVRVSKVIFLVNLVVMFVTIGCGVAWVVENGADLSRFIAGERLAEAHAAARSHGDPLLPGFATLGVLLIPTAMGSAILGASGVESVMNIPEELERPRRDVLRIYRWMLSILLVVGGSLSILLFLVLPPKALVGASGFLLAELGRVVVAGVTGNETLGRVWHAVIVANAALILIGATNTGFAGARGLWVTMARDNLLPRFLLKRNFAGAFSRMHWLMVVGIILVCWEASASMSRLERWYGATFGLVMCSGIVSFILLRRYKGEDRRLYWAPWNVRIWNVKVPIAALVGSFVLCFALMGLYAGYREDIGAMRTLFVLVLSLVCLVLVGHEHRPILRAGHTYVRRVLETVENDTIDTADRTLVVAVGSVRIGRLLKAAIDVARAQSKVTGIPYRRIVVFHMTKSVRREYVYKVSSDSIRPSGIEGNAVRIFTEMTELAPEDMDLYLVLVPNKYVSKDKLHAAMDSLVDFHTRHGFRGHIVLIGDYGVSDDDKQRLQERLEGSTLVIEPV